MTQAVQTGAFTKQTAGQLLLNDVVAITASGAIDPHTPQSYAITKAGVAAMTLAAPTSGTDDGVTIEIFSTTAFAHTVTATGLFQNGSGSVNLETAAANAGAYLLIQAYQGKWQIMAAINWTLS